MRRTTRHRWLVLFATLAVAVAAPSLAAARAWLGVYTQEVTSELRDALELSGDGVLVTNVVPGSPAERNGIRKGDVIVSVDRKPVASPADLSEIVGNSRSGESISLSIKRRGGGVTLSVRLADRPNDQGEDGDMGDVPAPPMAPKAPAAPRAPKAPHEMRWYSSDGEVDPDEVRDHVHEIAPGFAFDFDGSGQGKQLLRLNGLAGLGRGRLGVRIETLSDDLASALGASGTHGALVVEVIKETPAEKAGLRAGDIITAVEGSAVSDGDDLVTALRSREGKVSLSVVRRGAKLTVVAELEDSPRVIRLRDGERPRGLGRMGEDGKFEIRVKGDADEAELREELKELREELRQLREELRNHK